MKRPIPIVIAAAAVLSGTAARANPITDKVLKVRQVPHTTHVQITYGVDPNVLQLTDPKELKRDNETLSATWTTYASFSANTGSGLVNLNSAQFCDCDVSLGQHEYAVTVEGYGGSDETLTMPITVVADLPDPPDAGVVDPDAEPWDIPEPNDLQGLECTAACTPVVNPDGGAHDPDAGDQPPPKDRGGCSLAGDPGLTLLGVFLGGLLLLGLRRRRRR